MTFTCTEKQKVNVTHFIATITLLWCYETKPIISPKYACNSSRLRVQMWFEKMFSDNFITRCCFQTKPKSMGLYTLLMCLLLPL